MVAHCVFVTPSHTRRDVCGFYGKQSPYLSQHQLARLTDALSQMEDTSIEEIKPGILFSKVGMHEYNGTLYLPFSPPSLLREVEKFDFSPGDTLIATYPKSGTTLLSEIVWLVHNDVNIEKARRLTTGEKIPFLEHTFPGFNPVEYYRAKEVPRVIKTHLPSTFYRTPIERSTIKVVVMIRDPRDVLVSYYRLYKQDPGYIQFTGSWNDFFRIFEANQLFGGDWFQNTLDWLRFGDRENVLIGYYENVLSDPIDYVNRIARFCDKQLTDYEMKSIADYAVGEMADSTAIGEWKGFFSADQTRRFKELYDKHMNGTCLYCV